MSYEEDRIALESRLSTTVGLAGVVIKFTNAKVEDPGESDYLAASISYNEAQEVSLELTPLRRYTGVFYVQVFVKEGKGSGSAGTKADTVADRFRGQVFASGSNKIRCYTPLLQNVGPDGRGWYQFNVAIPFKRDQKH